MNIAQRLQALRQIMAQMQLDAFLIPSSDPHDSEYLAPHWQCRAWLSGFTGSAGTLFVCSTAAALWTDSRYYLQAEQQLTNSGIELMRDGETQTPNFAQWLLQHITGSTRPLRVGFVGEIASYALTEGLHQFFTNEHHAVTFISTDDVFAHLWKERPVLPPNEIYLHDLRYTQHSTQEKIAKILEHLPDTNKTPCLLLNDLSEIAWILNLRGSDINYNPLFYAYLTISATATCLYVDNQKVSSEVRLYLQEQGISLREYKDINLLFTETDLQTIQFLHTPSLNYALVEAFSLAANKQHTKELPILQCISSPIALLRACKDAAEIKGFEQAMVADGVAMVKFLRWLDESKSSGSIEQETEYSLGQQLETFRKENPMFRGNSFATIVGYAANGAIVHYEAHPTTAAPLLTKGLLLIDSGAQYQCGTTDLTRTLALGPLTEEEKRAYTLVLKGMIALSRAKFPRGTLGIQLDLAARYAMWQEGYDYGHGTGHGVGSHLCVHEGPMQIRKELRPNTRVPLQKGMVLSNEPGIYVAGKFGIRIENLLLVTHDQQTDFGVFLNFKTLTLCPIATAPIMWDLLTEQEIGWLNAYHAEVCQKLLPLLANPADKHWLLQATQKVL